VTEQDLLLNYVRRLNVGGFSCMLTGSMASNAWGIPRTTHDLDFVIQLPPSNVPSFMRAFSDADYFIDEASVRAAYMPPHQLRRWAAPLGVSAELEAALSGAFRPKST